MVLFVRNFDKSETEPFGPTFSVAENAAESLRISQKICRADFCIFSECRYNVTVSDSRETFANEAWSTEFFETIVRVVPALYMYSRVGLTSRSKCRSDFKLESEDSEIAYWELEKK